MGGLIVRIIQAQTERRDGVIWVYGLRDEYPNNIDKVGLKSIILRRNKLGRNFMRALTRWVKYDEYLRHIDISYNRINIDSTKQFLVNFKQNKSLVSLEMRGNSGYTDSIQKKFAFILLRNIEYCKNNNKFIENSWLKKDIYDIEIPSSVMKKLESSTKIPNSNINIKTSKEFLANIDVSLQPKPQIKAPKTSKNAEKKLQKQKYEDDQTLQTNVSTNKSYNKSVSKRSKFSSK